MASLARSVESVPHSRIRELAEVAMSMDGVLRLYFGESNLPTPDYIKQAAIKALADGYTFYTENAGMPSLRRAIARHYQKWHGVELDPESEIVITASGVQALNVSLRAMLDPGDEALVLTPAWPNGSSILAMANAVARQIPHPLEGGRYHIDFAALEAAAGPRTRLLLYTSPSNPLGWVATEEEQQRLLDFCRTRGLWLVADEVYDRLYYADGALGRPVPSMEGHAGRRRGGDSFVLEELLHDGMACGLADWPARSGAQSDAAQRVHHFARSQFCAEGCGNGAGVRRSRTGRDAAAIEGEPGFLRRGPACHAGRDHA
jgi:aspartate/methionine/tyrosine aminotransferase